ncbi:hypothetical protein V500_11426 [Pseudogymnoascus sp. VKM F-4518 (FW-2643)]|nr:hypothetical protein V500_11426 [Pseudogymnoascus sp. VKM F-4518 (FW-2643)]
MRSPVASCGTITPPALSQGRKAGLESLDTRNIATLIRWRTPQPFNHWATGQLDYPALTAASARHPGPDIVSCGA